MSASVTDKITSTRNAARPNSARVSSGRSSGGTTLACDNLAGWPTDSKVHFVTYTIDSTSNPVVGTQLDCSGIVSGNNIGSFTVIDGTDTGNSVNDVVEMLPTAAWGQDLSDALTSQHTRTGTHKSITNTGGITTDTLTTSGNATVGGTLGVTGIATFAAAPVFPALSITNAELAQNIAWTSYVPSWTNCTVTNSTVVAAYQQIGKRVEFHIKLTFAGGDTPSGNISVSLPVTSLASYGTGMPLAACTYEDAGNNYYPGRAFWTTTTTITLFAENASSTYTTMANTTATIPFTFGNADIIYIHGSYEAA